ncbi:hypothetical protein C4580_00730 [Candidatus Woesearchaeota archaeon]|nr:MAG: hypothetical protein C4580_00730 [Candidatus Woesearchaeota archaeon]
MYGVEVVSALLFWPMVGYLAWGVSGVSTGTFFLALLIGLVFADFASGFVHWAADTWGSQDWPVVGQSLLKSFRDHHRDPMGITRHDYFETNGDSFLVSLPVLFPSVLYLFGFWRLVAVVFFVGIAFTNQFHKWAHEVRPAGFVRVLQKSGLILSKKGHRGHHRRPFSRNYCITTGWLNPLLNKVCFWRILEKVITKMTGAVPRKEEQGPAIRRNRRALS